MQDLQAEILSLTEALTRYQHAYYVEGRPLVSDSEFDRLFDRLLALEAAHPHLRRADSPTLRVGSDLDTSLAEVEHTIAVLSLDKAYTATEVHQWITKSAERAEEAVAVVLEEKIDGVSIVLYYEDGLLARALTRGNGYVGNDVTANVQTIASIPLSIDYQGPVAVRGEIYLPKSSFARLNETMEVPYASPRNLAAGSIRRNKSKEVAQIPLDIFIYEGFWDGEHTTHLEVLSQLAAWGFKLNPSLAYFAQTQEQAEVALSESGLAGFALAFGELDRFVEEESERRESLDYEIDGLVAKIDSLSARETLGYTGHHPRWAIAYKFESPQAETRVLDIDVQVGRSGRITPVARLEPVALAGSTISNVTLHNQDYICLLDLGVGDWVAISRRGDVIPAVEEVLEKADPPTVWQLPEECPICSTSLVEQGAHTFCPNHMCPAQVRGRIEFFASKGGMDIEGYGPETIGVLIDLKALADIEDIYTIDYDAVLADQPGFGEKKIAHIKAGVEASKERPFGTLLVALGIPELGKKAAELLIDAGLDSIEKLFAVADANDIDRLVAIHQIGEKSAQRYIAAFSDPAMKKRIEALQAAGLAMEAEEREVHSDQSFVGQVWSVTGSFEHFKPRSKAMAEVEKRGGRTTSGVTAKTTHLLAGPGGGSKLKRAEELGTIIVDEATFLKLLATE